MAIFNSYVKFREGNSFNHHQKLRGFYWITSDCSWTIGKMTMTAWIEPTKGPENVQSKHQYIWVSPPVTRCGRTLPKNGTSSQRATSFRTWLEHNNVLKPPSGWLWNYPPDPPSKIAREIPAFVQWVISTISIAKIPEFGQENVGKSPLN